MAAGNPVVIGGCGVAIEGPRKHPGVAAPWDKVARDQAPTAANEATRTEWDPVSKQPIFKVTAVRVTKLADASGPAAPDPATTAAAAGTETVMPAGSGPAAPATSTPGAST